MAAPAAIMGVASLLGNIAGGVSSGISSRRDRQQADALMQKILAEYEGLSVPEFMEYNPELMGASELSSISLDPAMRAAQMESLDQLSPYTTGEVTDADMSALNLLNRDVAQQERAQRQALMQGAARRGVSGSGLDLAQQIMAQQAGNEARAGQADRLAVEAQRRALQAIGQRAGQAGQLRSQDYGEQANLARAQDAIRQFNTQNVNQGRLQNIMQRQQQFQNEMNLAGAKAGAYGGAAGRSDQSADTSRNMMGGFISGAGDIMGRMGAMNWRRPNQPVSAVSPYQSSFGGGSGSYSPAR